MGNAFERVDARPRKPPPVSSNKEYYDAYLADKKKKRRPKLAKLLFSNTGQGETPSSVRRIPENELRAEVLVRREKVKASPKRLTPLCRLIRRMTAEQALDQLRFSPKMWSREIMKLLHQGIKKAKLDHGLEMKDLYVASCFATRSEIIKTIIPHSRGRFGIGRARKSHLNIILRDLAGKSVEEYELVARKLVKHKEQRQTPTHKLKIVLQHL